MQFQVRYFTHCRFHFLLTIVSPAWARLGGGCWRDFVQILFGIYSTPRMQSPFEIQSIQVGDTSFRCLVWYNPNYDMYSGTVVHDNTICIVTFFNSHRYSSPFDARPELASLSFSIVRDLFQLLLGSGWKTFITDECDRRTVQDIESRLLSLRRHWILKGFEPEWTTATAKQAEMYEAGE